MYVAGNGVDPGVIRLELPVSVAERLSLVGRLSEVLTIVLASPTGARFPPHRFRPRYQAAQRGLPAPPGVAFSFFCDREMKRRIVVFIRYPAGMGVEQE